MRAQLKIVKQNFENNYFNQVQTISNPKKAKQILIQSAKNYAAEQLKKGNSEST